MDKLQLHEIVDESDNLMDIFLKDIDEPSIVKEYKLFSRLGVLASHTNAREIIPHPAFLAGQWVTKHGYKQLNEQRKLLEASLKSDSKKSVEKPTELDW